MMLSYAKLLQAENNLCFYQNLLQCPVLRVLINTNSFQEENMTFATDGYLCLSLPPLHAPCTPPTISSKLFISLADLPRFHTRASSVEGTKELDKKMVEKTALVVESLSSSPIVSSSNVKQNTFFITSNNIQTSTNKDNVSREQRYNQMLRKSFVEVVNAKVANNYSRKADNNEDNGERENSPLR